MKKLLLFLLCFVALTASAQNGQEAVPELKVGFVSYDALLNAMPEYASHQANMQQLREKYEAEQKRVENDFNKKYEEFLDGQASFPKTILQKRQSELQEMLDKNIAFKKESQRLLAEADIEVMSTLQAKLQAALKTVCISRKLAFIANTDDMGILTLNPFISEDVTEAVKAELNK